jgi:hypothetical protein
MDDAPNKSRDLFGASSMFDGRVQREPQRRRAASKNRKIVINAPFGK